MPYLRIFRVVLTQGVPECVVQPDTTALEENKGLCVLAHSLNDELDEMKRCFAVLLVLSRLSRRSHCAFDLGYISQ